MRGGDSGVGRRRKHRSPLVSPGTWLEDVALLVSQQHQDPKLWQGDRTGGTDPALPCLRSQTRGSGAGPTAAPGAAGDDRAALRL